MATRGRARIRSAPRWRAEVKFRGVDPDAFAGFAEPGYAKIVWTLEAEPLGPAASRFRTETRVSRTDPRSRRLCRRYWAERRFRASAPEPAIS